MSDLRDESIRAAVKVLNDGGGQPGSGLHSWRCEHPDRYGPCTCVAEVASDVVAAVEPIIHATVAEEIAQECESDTDEQWLTAPRTRAAAIARRFAAEEASDE
jgi:hypothetical protein